MFNKVILHILFYFFFVVTTVAQQQNLPLNREFNLVNQKEFSDYKRYVHTSFLPLNQSLIEHREMAPYFPNSLDTIHKDYLINIKKEEKRNRSWFMRKLLYENFVVVDTGKFYLTIDPLFNIEAGADSEDNRPDKPKLLTNTRGIIVKGNIGEKFSFQTSVYENQANLPQYLVNYVRANGVVPGQGRVKVFKLTGVDYNSATANISYSPAKFINFQIGNGRNFIGDGYRSLLLSDATYNYPYFKITTQFGKNKQFQYTKMNAALSNLVRREDGSTTESLFTRKSMSTHYFSWLTTKWLNIGLFESTVWQTEDSSGTFPYNYQQLNPIIGVNALTTGFNNNNNSIVGSNIKIKLPFKTILYNQFVYDGSSKYGYQMGVRYFGINNLTLQAEYNKVEPYTYSSSTTLQNYSHFNEALAHPLGANFDELVGIVNYKYKWLFLQIKANLINSNTLGNNIFISEDQITPFAVNTPVKTTIVQVHMGYLINPKNNMSFVVGFTRRKQEYTYKTDKTNYIYFALRTSLRNLYTDF
jgi:hypothetical protein